MINNTFPYTVQFCSHRPPQLLSQLPLEAAPYSLPPVTLHKALQLPCPHDSPMSPRWTRQCWQIYEQELDCGFTMALVCVCLLLIIPSWEDFTRHGKSTLNTVHSSCSSWNEKHPSLVVESDRRGYFSRLPTENRALSKLCPLLFPHHHLLEQKAFAWD